MLQNPTIWLITSVITLLASVIIVIAVKPVWGIDFTGGSLLEIEGGSNSIAAIDALLADQFNLTSTIQTTKDDTLLIRIPVIDEEKHQAIISALREGDILKGEERRFESIGPTIGQELRKKSMTAILLVVVMMVIYLAYTFRGVKGLVAPWKFGVAAVYALIHDLVLVTAMFVIFGKLWDTPIDTMFVTAQLAILGYSVNDTIVLFNRVKWEWLTERSGSLLSIIDKAMRATLGRSLNTSFTTLLVLLALLLFGGSTIQWFIVALMLGTITGTYSSLYVAPPLLHYLAKGKS